MIKPNTFQEQQVQIAICRFISITSYILLFIIINYYYYYYCY